MIISKSRWTSRNLSAPFFASPPQRRQRVGREGEIFNYRHWIMTTMDRQCVVTPWQLDWENMNDGFDQLQVNVRLADDETSEGEMLSVTLARRCANRDEPDHHVANINLLMGRMDVCLHGLGGAGLRRLAAAFEAYADLLDSSEGE